MMGLKSLLRPGGTIEISPPFRGGGKKVTQDEPSPVGTTALP
jgi:hypothetical protein